MFTIWQKNPVGVSKAIVSRGDWLWKSASFKERCLCYDFCIVTWSRKCTQNHRSSTLVVISALFVSFLRVFKHYILIIVQEIYIYVMPGVNCSVSIMVSDSVAICQFTVEMPHPLPFESEKGRICVAWVWNREGTEKLVNGKQQSVWFVATGMRGLPRLEFPRSDLTIYLPSGISDIFRQMVSNQGLYFVPSIKTLTWVFSWGDFFLESLLCAQRLWILISVLGRHWAVGPTVWLTKRLQFLDVSNVVVYCIAKSCYFCERTLPSIASNNAVIV